MDAVESSLGFNGLPDELDADRPCPSLSEDTLGRELIVRGLVSQILKRRSRETLVFSVEGPWGSGKSSLLNFIEMELKDSEELRVVRFEPWWFSNADDLIVRFFHELQSNLGGVGDDKLKSAAVKAGAIAKLLKPASNLVPGLKEAVDMLIEATGTVTKAVEDQSKNIRGLRLEIETLLDEASTKILVLIDDLDRLQSREIANVFRMIKGISALDGILYIVAFDPEVVQRALSDAGGVGYLDKIIQCPIRLPQPTLAQLRAQIEESLGSLLTSDLSRSRWWCYYDNIFIARLATYRAIKRLANTCHTLFPMVSGEVEPADFVAVQGMRLFFPDAYGALIGFVAGTGRVSLKPGMSIKPPAEFLKEVLGEEYWTGVAPLIDELLTTHHPSPLISPARNLSTYLRLAPEEGVITNKQWAALVRDLHRGSASLRDILAARAGERKYLDSLFTRLDQLLERPGGIDSVVPANVISALLSGSDLVISRDRPEHLAFPVFWTVNRLVFLGFRHFPPKSAAKLLRRQFRESCQPVTCARLCLTIEDTDAMEALYTSRQIAAFQHELPYLKRRVLTRIRNRATSGRLWSEYRDFVFLHAIWQDWEESLAAVRWLQRLLKSEPTALGELVYRSFGEFTRQGFEEWRPTRVREFKLDHLVGLERMVGWKRKSLLRRARRVLRLENLSEEHQDALETLVQVIQKN